MTPPSLDTLMSIASTVLLFWLAWMLLVALEESGRLMRDRHEREEREGD